MSMNIGDMIGEYVFAEEDKGKQLDAIEEIADFLFHLRHDILKEIEYEKGKVDDEGER